MTRRCLFGSFRRLHRLQGWLTTHVSPGGRLVLGAAVASGVFGVDLRNSLAYQVLALSLGLLVVALAGVALTPCRFGFRRSLPRFATVGEAFRYGAEVTNLGRRRRSRLALREMPYVELPSFDAFRRLREPGAGSRNWLDRYTGYSRWAWMVRFAEGLSGREQPVPPLAAGETARVEIELVGRRRGPVSLGGAMVLCSDPLGLLRRAVRVPAAGTVLLLPKAYPVPSFTLGRGRRREVSGRVDRDSHGGVDEFKGLREFRTGDALRLVDWRASARLGEPMVKVFHDEHRGALTVFLDTDGERYGERFEAAVSVAASLVGASCHGVPTELVLVRPGAPGDGPRHPVLVRAHGRERSLVLLATVQACVMSPEAQAAALAGGRRADAVVAVLLGWDGRKQALAEALRRGTGGDVLPLAVLEAGAVPPAAVSCVRMDRLAHDLARFAGWGRTAQRRAGTG